MRRSFYVFLGLIFSFSCGRSIPEGVVELTPFLGYKMPSSYTEIPVDNLQFSGFESTMAYTQKNYTIQAGHTTVHCQELIQSKKYEQWDKFSSYKSGKALAFVQKKDSLFMYSFLQDNPEKGAAQLVLISPDSNFVYKAYTNNYFGGRITVLE